MSGRYQQAPYSDNEYGAHQGGYDNAGYGNGGGYGNNEYPMSSANPYAATSSNPAAYGKKPKSHKKWWIIGAILAVVIIVGAVLGGVLGSRASKNNDNSAQAGQQGSNDSNGNSNSGSNTGNTNGNAAGHDETRPTGTQGAAGANTAVPTLLSYYQSPNLAVQTQTGANGQAYLAVATDTYALPAYATGTSTEGLSSPSRDSAPGTNGAWPADDAAPSSGSLRSHPRLIAPKYKWDALTGGMIAADPYLSFWSAQIIQNATDLIGQGAVPYDIDGGLDKSGVLDVARKMKQRIKNLAYAYRITQDTKFVDRAWLELNTASLNGDWTGVNSTDPWNCANHFLDCAEFTSAFAIGYDWLFDALDDEKKATIRNSIINFGLKFGQAAYAPGSSYWWTGVSPGTNSQIINGNWNCVCNAGMILGVLAIQDEDSSFNDLLENAIGSSKANCFKGAVSDGTWAETPDYWYFGTTGAAEMVSALTTAQGSDSDLASSSPGFALTSEFHMYVQGMTSLFNWGDHGPNKFSSTANSLLLWATTFDKPVYALYQRDRIDAAEPFSMFWYDPTVEGAWWDGLALDRQFSSAEAGWASARSSWTDNSGTYWAMKSAALLNHQTHGDLDLGDFVIDAMGQRWAGDLGSDQYNGEGYFSSEGQDSVRYHYYRKRTEGQNTIVIGGNNQLVDGAGSNVKFESSGSSQGLAPSYAPAKDDTAFFTLDMSSAYGGATVKRGIRFINGRLQVLQQDEVTNGPSGQAIQWRMQTNATITGTGSDTATLTIGERTLTAKIIQSEPAGLTFGEAQPVYAQAPQDSMPNPDSRVLTIENSAGGSMTVSVLFTPQWPDKSEGDYVTPPNVGIDAWSLTSHN